MKVEYELLMLGMAIAGGDRRSSFAPEFWPVYSGTVSRASFVSLNHSPLGVASCHRTANTSSRPHIVNTECIDLHCRFCRTSDAVCLTSRASTA